jgi:Holliday junction resolvase
MSQRESKLSRKIMDALRQQGVFCFKIHGSEFMAAGLPDIVACVDGRFVGLETKMPGEREDVSKIQAHRHQEIWRAGGECYVICSVDEALEKVRLLRQAAADRR